MLFPCPKGSQLLRLNDLLLIYFFIFFLAMLIFIEENLKFSENFLGAGLVILKKSLKISRFDPINCLAALP
uniref:Uncharacterized protein n=1 Tax=Moorena producens (strain JHB) TaxID=1454205 RepID=A0A1D9G8S4_MOOP1